MISIIVQIPKTPFSQLLPVVEEMLVLANRVKVPVRASWDYRGNTFNTDLVVCPEDDPKTVLTLYGQYLDKNQTV